MTQPTGVIATATGEAEVDYPRSTPDIQEIEFSIRSLVAGSSYSVRSDGLEVGSGATDSGRRVELGVEARVAGARR